MKIGQEHIAQIRTQFAELQNKDDLRKLLSGAKNMLYGKECKPVQLKSLTYYANPSLCKKRYQTFSIKKKSGADRTINAPVKGLKSILRSLNFVLHCVYKPHEAATGFVLKKSIVDNAKKHVGHHYVFNVDLKDFFHSFDRNRVKLAFMYEPFNLREEREELAFMLACLCTHPIQMDGEIKNVLPQGSPCSPTLTNILCRRLDHRLSGLAKRFRAVYTRYADDITFSSYHNIYKREENSKLNNRGCYDNFIAELERLLSEEGLKINSEKTRLQKACYRQEATGLVVNEKVNVHSRYVKQIRMWLYYWEKYGYEKANQIFKRDYIADKGHVKKVNAKLENVLYGKLEFLKMVKGFENKTYNKLKERFDALIINSDKTAKEEKVAFGEGALYDTSVLKENLEHQPAKHLDLETKLKSFSEKNYSHIKVEDKINCINSQNLQLPSKDSWNELKYPIQHNPLKTAELLSNFSSNQNDLKYATHSWEFGKYEGYDDFMKKITKSWKKISNQLKDQKPELHAKISNFLLNEKLGQKNDKGYYISWGEKQLKFGWSSPELKSFCDETHNNPLICPIPDRIRELDKSHNFSIFSDYVSVFKNEIEFREDSNNLKKLFLDKRKEILSYDFTIELNNIEGKSFFTDVAYFSKTIETIFLESFKKKTSFPNIKVNISKVDNYYLLSITQVDSWCTRNLHDPRIIRPEGGTMGSICNNMKNLADFSIVSRFNDDKFYRINYLVSDNNTKQIEDIENEIYDGFTFEFKFYVV